MSILNQLASSLNRRDEEPNIELAAIIAKSNNAAAVLELIKGLENKRLQNDCIKVLYEIGNVKPTLIDGHIKTFLSLLHSKNNRLQWGAMTALGTIADEHPANIYKALPQIIDAANNGSVITRDHAVVILIKLYTINKYMDDCFPLLIDQLKSCPVNQLPMYAENIAAVIMNKHKKAFAAVLQSRLQDVDKESKKKRIEKVILKVSK